MHHLARKQETDIGTIGHINYKWLLLHSCEDEMPDREALFLNRAS